MSGYSKLWSEVVTSSIWSEDDKTRIVWVTMLALKDQHGYVPASLPGLAHAARVEIGDCEKALAILTAPDKYSRSTDHEGRRVERVDGGWVVLNHTKYRDRKGPSTDPTAAERQRRFRERHASNGDVTESNGKVTVSNGDVTVSNGKVTLRNVTPVSVSVSVPHSKGAQPTEDEAMAYAIEIDFEGWHSWFDHFQANGWLVGGKSKMKDWKAAMRNGKRRSAEFKANASRGGKRTNADKLEEWKRQAAEQAKARTQTASMPPEFNLEPDSKDSVISMLSCEEVAP